MRERISVPIAFASSPGATDFISRRIIPRFCMSARTATLTPGYWTLTATSLSSRRALYTWPIDAAAIGTGSKVSKTSSSASSYSASRTFFMSLNETFGAASRSSASLSWKASRNSLVTRPTSRNDITWPSFIAAPFIVPSAATICSAVSSWRRASACWASPSLRARLAARVPIWRTACPAASRPTVAERRSRDVGIGSLLLRAMPAVSAALDLRAGHDVVAPVRPADPRLVAAVVVVAEQHERGRLAHRRARLGALGVEAAPDADERVGLPLVGDRRRLRMPGADDGLGRHLHERVHDRRAQVGVGRVAGRAHAPDGVLEERVAGEDVALDEQGEHPPRVPRRVQRRHLEAADADRLARRHRAGRALHEGGFVGGDEHLQAGPALGQPVEVADVVEVVVGEQDVGRGHAVALGGGDEREDGPAGVDEERLAALLPDEVRVGQELIVHRALELHAFDATRRIVVGTPDRAGAARSVH